MPNEVLVQGAANPAADGYVRDFYVYLAECTFTAVGERRPIPINLQADGDFVLVKIMYTIDDTTPPPGSGGAFIQIIDNGSDRRLFDNPVPIASVCGTGQRPFILPWVHRFPRNGTILVELTNDDAEDQVVRVVLAGYKLIPASRL